MERLFQTLQEPRFVTVGSVVSYLVILILGIDLIPTLTRQYDLLFWVPAVFMCAGALVGLPAAWIGGENWARVELITMPLTIGGLLGGIVIEASEAWNTDFISHLLVALGAIVLTAVIMRWYWIRKHYDL